MSISKSKQKSGPILEIMTYIEEEYIESALNRLGYMYDEDYPGRKPHKHNRFSRKKREKGQTILYLTMKRVAIFIGIVVLAASTTVATAMAFNEEFRETVKEFIFEFFHIEEEEVVPQLPGTEEVTIDTMFVEPDRSILGGVIEGTMYIHRSPVMPGRASM